MGNSIIFRFLKWICPTYLFEEIEGDLIQRFYRDLSKYGIRRGEAKAVLECLAIFPPWNYSQKQFFHGIETVHAQS
jgi:hypothetical protein